MWAREVRYTNMVIPVKIKARWRNRFREKKDPKVEPSFKKQKSPLFASLGNLARARGVIQSPAG